MATWGQFARQAPELAQKGRALLYRTGGGEALLATVSDDEPPRVHPIAIEEVDGGLYAFILPSAKLTNLAHDGRYALHAYPDFAQPHEFALRGHVRRVDDATRGRLAARWAWQVGDAAAFEFLIEQAVLGERVTRQAWPPKYMSWTERS